MLLLTPHGTHRRVPPGAGARLCPRRLRIRVCLAPRTRTPRGACPHCGPSPRAGAVAPARRARFAARWLGVALVAGALAGRVAFALGMLPAALAIRLLVGEQHSEAGRWRRRTLIAVGVLTALSGAFSPLVALFAGL